MIDLESTTEEESEDDDDEAPLSSLKIKMREEKRHNEERPQMKGPK